jgi:transcription termination/antitermination protein NusG
MKDPAVIDESTSTSPSDRDPGDDTPVADVLADAAELHREADAAEDTPTSAEPVTDAATVDEAVVEEPVTDAETVDEAVVEEPVDEVAAPAEEPVVEESVAEVGDPIDEPVIEEPTVEEPTVEEPTAEAAAAIEEPIAEEPTVDEPTSISSDSILRRSSSTVEEPIEEPAVEEPVLEVAAAEPVPVDEKPAPDDPFGGPGDWYVVHTYAGYENKVKTNLESRIHTMQMEDKIFRVHIPMEDVMEIKSGKKQVVQKKIFPGYLLVKMWYDNDSWYVVRNTPGVTGFVSSGTGSKPTPLSKREIDKILIVKKEEVKPQFRLGFEEGDVVRIISGPFADFNGTINEINVDQSKLKVLVNIFDRETPVELGFDQVSKV